MDEECLHGFLQRLLAVHHLVYAPEARTFLVYVVCRLHSILSSLNMYIAEFMFNWMVELNLIFIPFYFILIRFEVESFDLESPFLHIWSDPVDEDIFRILPWFIQEDPLSFFVLLKVVPLLAVTADLVQLWVDLVHVFDQAGYVEAHLHGIGELAGELEEEAKISLFSICV
jgi:hypothetical protein